LPLAARTAFDYLKAGRRRGAQDLRRRFQQPGEVETDAYLKRAYPDFDALTANGEFTMLAETLLRPLLEAIPASKGRLRKAGSGGESPRECRHEQRSAALPAAPGTTVARSIRCVFRCMAAG
jgi:hypothetical protein